MLLIALEGFRTTTNLRCIALASFTTMSRTPLTMGDRATLRLCGAVSVEALAGPACLLHASKRSKDVRIPPREGKIAKIKKTGT